jgi:hypothetical protein
MFQDCLCEGRDPANSAFAGNSKKKIKDIYENVINIKSTDVECCRDSFIYKCASCHGKSGENQHWENRK